MASRAASPGGDPLWDISISVHRCYCLLFLFFFPDVFFLFVRPPPDVFLEPCISDTLVSSSADTAFSAVRAFPPATFTAVFCAAPRVFITYQRAPVIHTEQYAPQTIPTINGSANSLMELTPITYSTATIINVVSDV